MTTFFAHWGHLLTAMLVFGGLWLYLWNLDAKVAKLAKQVEDEKLESEA